jgi:Tol biopolymer transport system component
VSDRDGNHEIYVMDAAGTSLSRLTNHRAEDLDPAWSPDGTQIAFPSDRGGDIEIFVMNADGTDVRQLTDDPGGDLFAAWSPDGTQIAFASDRDGDFEIFVMHADGTDVRQLTDHPSDDIAPAWSPDGTKIAYAARGLGGVNYEIHVMNPDGTAPTTLTEGRLGRPPIGRLTARRSRSSASASTSRAPTEPTSGGSPTASNRIGRQTAPAWSSRSIAVTTPISTRWMPTGRV